MCLLKRLADTLHFTIDSDIEFQDQDYHSEKTKSVGVVYNHVKLPHSQDEFQGILSSPLYFDVAKQVQSSYNVLLTPKLHATVNTTCECSGTYGHVKPSYHTAMVYGLNKSCYIQTPDLYPCDNCELKMEFDGVSHGLVRVSKAIYFDITLANFIQSSIILGPTSITGIYRVLKAVHDTHGSTYCGKDIHLAATWTFLSRSSNDVFRSFNCCHCGDLSVAPILIGDGTKLACQCNSRDHPPRMLQTTPRTGIDFDSRVFISNIKLRKLMLTFCGYKFKQDASKPVAMSIVQQQSMIEFARQTCPSIVSLLQILIENASPAGFCNDIWKPLVSDLARVSPISNGFIREPHILGPVLSRIATIGFPGSGITEISIDDRFRIGKLCPTLYDALLLSGLMTKPRGITWNALVSVLRRLIQFCNYVDDIQMEDRECSNIQEPVLDQDIYEWFPNAPYLRHLHKYDDTRAGDDVVCIKKAPSSRKRLPGIYLFVCPHMQCLGITVYHHIFQFVCRICPYAF